MHLSVHAVHKIEEEKNVLLSPAKREALSYRQQRQDRCVAAVSQLSICWAKLSHWVGGSVRAR